MCPIDANSIDETTLVDRLMPKSWKCPHCCRRNQPSEYADEIIMEHFKFIQHCEHCGYLHIWYLRLTDKFKKGVISLLVAGVQKGDADNA